MVCCMVIVPCNLYLMVLYSNGLSRGETRLQPQAGSILYLLDVIRLKYFIKSISLHGVSNSFYSRMETVAWCDCLRLYLSLNTAIPLSVSH